MVSNKVIGSIVGGAAWGPVGVAVGLFVGHLLDCRMAQGMAAPNRFKSVVSQKGIKTNAYGEIEE